MALDPAERLRVLHVSQPISEGVAVVVGDLALDLVGHGMDVAVVSPAGGYLAEVLHGSEVEHLTWDAGRNPGPSVLGETLSLHRIIERWRPTVVHLHSSKAGLAGRLALRGSRPTVFSPHAWSFYHSRGAIRWAARNWERWAVRWTDSILCGSEEETAAGNANGILADYVTLPNSAFIQKPMFGQDAAREQLLPALNPQVPLLACLGRLAEQKGQDILLRAWPLIKRQVPEARLVIVGGGELEPRLKEMADPDVIFTGSVPREDVPSWVIAADVLAFPSRWETLSLAVLEALQLGRPVVVSSCGGMREALAGGEGSMVKIESPQAWADAISIYLADRAFARSQGEKAAEKWREVHMLRRDRNMQSYRDFLVRVAAERHAQ